MSDPGCSGAARPRASRLSRVDSQAEPVSGLGMPGEEERAFLAAREELARALRQDSAQVFPPERLKPFLATSLPPAARYLQLDAGRLVRCNAHGEVRLSPPGVPWKGLRGQMV